MNGVDKLMARRKKEAEITPQEQEKENDSNMAENEAMLFADNEHLPLDTVENAFNEPEIDTAEKDNNAVTANEPEIVQGEPKQRGRKCRDKNGEKVQKFATVYLTPTQATKFTALCNLDGVNVSARIMNLIEAEISANEDLISDYFALEKKRKERRKSAE